MLKHANESGQPISDETARLFWLGKIIHTNVQSGLGNKDFLHEIPINGIVAAECDPLPDGTKVFRSAKVSGRIDTLRLNPSEIVELKTVRSKAFNYPLPQPSHILQVHCYLTFPPDGYDPQVARIVYIAKDGDKVAEYVITKDKVLTDAVQENIARLERLYQRYVTTGVLPPALNKVPLVKKGQIIRYVKSGSWGKAGDPKMINDHHVLYCDYRGTGRCCGD